MLRTVVLRPTQLDPVLGSAVDTWATVAVAIGTIGTVVYALFRDYFVTARRRPRLDLRFDRAGNDQVVIGTPRAGPMQRTPGCGWRTNRGRTRPTTSS